jgi:L-arabinose isomerase
MIQSWNGGTFGLLFLDAPFLEEQVEGFKERVQENSRWMAKRLGEVFHPNRISFLDLGIQNTRKEIEKAIREAEDSGCQGLCLVFLSYSPSLSLEEPLCNTDLPLLFLDITVVESFIRKGSPKEMLYNHGIHGVQDILSLLVRRERPFFLVTGHLEDPQTTVDIARGSASMVLADRFRRSRVGTFGTYLKGMGDFQVSRDILRERYGVEVVDLDKEEIARMFKEESTGDVEKCSAEIRAEWNIPDSDHIDEGLLKNCCRFELAMRKMLQRHQLNALALNAEEYAGAPWGDFVPFLTFSRLMGEGIGYAGEGDILTAALVQTLLAAYPEDATFTEMFCPDWKEDLILLSHVGEANHRIAGAPIKAVQKRYALTQTDALSAAFPYKPGRCMLVNLVPPSAGGECTLITVEGEMIDEARLDLPKSGEGSFSGVIRGWFRPRRGIRDMLKEYSFAGGTHHLGLVYEEELKILNGFAQALGWKGVNL